MKSTSVYRLTALFIFILSAVAVLYYGRLFLIPLSFGILLSMLFAPLSRWFESKGISRLWATLLCIIVLLLFVTLIILIIVLQAASISEDLPQIQHKLQQLLDTSQQWIQKQIGVAPEKQIEFAKKQVGSISQSANKFFTSVLGGAFGLITGFVLVLLYMFFLLWKREKYKRFFLKLFSADAKSAANDALEQIQKVAAQYLVGRLLSMLFLAVFYSIGLSIIGIENAILISLVAVLPTIIPYVGAFIGGIFPLLMALVSGSTGSVLPTLAVLVAAQVIDNNIIEPLVMGAKLNLSPFFTIIAIVLGELIWGIPGMILFEPLFAIIRIICAHIPRLHPYSFLLEDEVPEPKWVSKLKSLTSKRE